MWGLVISAQGEETPGRQQGAPSVWANLVSCLRDLLSKGFSSPASATAVTQGRALKYPQNRFFIFSDTVHLVSKTK